MTGLPVFLRERKSFTVAKSRLVPANGLSIVLWCCEYFSQEKGTMSLLSRDLLQLYKGVIGSKLIRKKLHLK
jgi:hypothetical protein